MIDYKYSDCGGIAPKDFLANRLLEFHANVNLKTAELNKFKTAHRNKEGYIPADERIAIYNTCQLIVTNNEYINFSGSLHKYFTDGDNSTDFTFYHLFSTIKDLHEKCKINPFLDRLHNIEWGVNVLLPFNTKTLLDSIISLRGKVYELRKYRGRGYCIKFADFDQYEIKIYDKGFQQGLNKNLLRFEIKVTTMHFLHAKEIPLICSAHLLDRSIHIALGELLADFWKQLIMNDWSITIQDAKPREQATLKDSNNPFYWRALKEKPEGCNLIEWRKKQEVYKKRLARFRELTLKYGKLNPQKIVLELIQSKWRELTQIEPEKLNAVNDFLANLPPERLPQNKHPKTLINKPEIEIKVPQNNHPIESETKPAVNSNFHFGRSKTIPSNICVPRYKPLFEVLFWGKFSFWKEGHRYRNKGPPKTFLIGKRFRVKCLKVLPCKNPTRVLNLLFSRSYSSKFCSTQTLFTNESEIEQTEFCSTVEQVSGYLPINGQPSAINKMMP